MVLIQTVAHLHSFQRIMFLTQRMKGEEEIEHFKSSILGMHVKKVFLQQLILFWKDFHHLMGNSGMSPVY